MTSMTGASRTGRASSGRSIEPSRTKGRKRGGPHRARARSKSELSTRSAIDEPLHPARTIDGPGQLGSLRRS